MRYLLLVLITILATECYGTQPVIVQRQFVTPSIFYSVGPQLRQQQYQEQIQLQKEFEEFRKWKLNQQALDQQAVHQEPTNQNGSDGLVAACCFKCHSGENPKGGVRLDGELTDTLKLKMLRMAFLGKMPKEEPLSNEVFTDFMKEVLE